MNAALRADLVRLEPQLCRWFAARVADPLDAEDLCHDALYAALAAAHRFRGDASVRTWLYAIARNVLARYRSRRQMVDLLHEESVPAPPGSDPLDAAVARDEHERLHVVVHTLSDRQRRIYALRYRDGESIRSIAVKLGSSEGTVKWHLHEIRNRIARGLGGPLLPHRSRTDRRFSD